MRSAGRALLISLSSACFACGATTPRAVAEPRKDEPLVRGDIESDAAFAHAIREHYTKHEYRIPMRDGVKLFTVAYVPKDASRTYPIMLQRTPYSVQPYGVDNYPSDRNGRGLRRFAPSAGFVKEGFIFVHQDVRGRLMSEGTFVDIRPHASSRVPPSADPHVSKKGEIDESTDAYDTIDWLVKNVPQNNGRVGAWGISYPGFYAAQTAIDAHPALKAVSPQAPVTDWFVGDDFHHNGAFFLGDAFGFLSNFGKARPKPTKKSSWGNEYDITDAYDFFLAMGPLANANTSYLEGKIAFWNDMMAHGTRDEWWRARDPRPWYKNVKPAVLTVGGWFDSEDCFGALETYRAFERQSPGAENMLVMGPWRHGGWSRSDGDRHGDITFGQKTSVTYRESIELPFFRRHLKGNGKEASKEALPEAYIFETGINQWHHYDAWPPRQAKKVVVHLQANGRLGTTAPPPPAGEDPGFDAWVSDPMKPVPYRDKPGPEIDGDYMSGDQRFAARRPDVVVFQTGELDGDVSMIGALEARLWVSTSGTDSDFVVKLVDVYPSDYADPDPNPTNVHMGGYQQLVRAEIMRGKFRNSLERPEPFEPNKPTLVRFSLPDIAHTFRTGHRIMVQVQSSWFPVADRNPQTFVDIYSAKAADFKIATQRIFHTADKPSSLEVMITAGTLPR
ncbi:MAG: CocE/NonD family hydrolase [Deltaproteobacteria bacterium]|nr:CocE/NonD family hydrolase [Deltaproteobacteria bacterium]